MTQPFPFPPAHQPPPRGWHRLDPACEHVQAVVELVQSWALPARDAAPAGAEGDGGEAHK